MDGIFKEDQEMIHNYLDKLTIEEIIKYAAQGYELVINDGHVVRLICEGAEGENHDKN